MKAYWQKLRQLPRAGANPATAPRAAPTPATYLAQVNPAVGASFTAQQRAEIERLLGLAMAQPAPQPAPKIVDLRFTVDLLVSRYFIVLMMGKDRRRAPRDVAVSRLTQVGNWLAAVLLLLGFNLALSASLLMLLYLVKSALGIDLLPGHFRGFGR